MEEKLLTNPEVDPTIEVLKKEFGDWYSVYAEFISEITSEAFSLKPEWKYYKDGKAWLCKICLKKKTVVWLSAWKNCFKLGFYFTEKTGAGIRNLNINSIYKKEYESHESIGKLKPLIVDVNQVSQLKDVYTLVDYKIGRI